MNVTDLDPDDSRWLEVLGHLRHDLYHTPEYFALDARFSGGRPKAYLATDGPKKLFFPYLIRQCDGLFQNASAATNISDVVSPNGYGGPLVSDAAGQDPEFVRNAMELFQGVLRGRGACSAFFRMHPLLSDGLLPLFSKEFPTSVSQTVALDLGLDEVEIWRNMRDTHRTTIEKSRTLGCVPRELRLDENLDCFLEIYTDTMVRVGADGAYFFPREYFAQLASMHENVHLFVIELAGEAAAACIVFECDGIVQAHLGGTRSCFLSKSPFHLIIHHIAGWAKSRGNRYFHLGGGVGGTKDRLLEFKLGFSRLQFPYLKLHLVINEQKYRELVTLRAQTIGVSEDLLLQGGYFPAYRVPSGP